jgi:peptide/nickel transport system substrate-binding protein
MERRIMLVALSAVLMVGFLFAEGGHAAPAAGKKLMIAVGQEPTTMDLSLAFSSSDYAITYNWGELLINRSANGDLGPGLATSWKVSPDGKEMEFTLRKNVTFHSGDPMTVKDVQFSFERERTKNMSLKTRFSSVEKLEVIDDYRFRIRFKAPDVSFIPNRGIAVVSRSYYDRVGEDKFVKEPVGTGPYKFVRHAPGEFLDVERFEEYWGDKPSVKEARFYFVPEDTTRVAKLKAGEVDIINNCPYPLLKDLQKNPDFKVIRFESNHPTVSVVFSTRNPKTPWHDRRVRLAMAYAIDCDAIVKNVLQGLPNRWPFLAPHEVGYDPDVKNYPYDPKKARELLAEAGYPKGFDMKLYWTITGRLPMTRETAEAVASYLEAVGIRTKLVGEEFAAWYSRYDASKTVDGDFVGIHAHTRAGAVDPGYTLEMMFGSNGRYSLYSNPELDKVAAEARSTMDDAKRAEIVKKAVRMIQQDVATIPLFNNVVLYCMKKNVDFKPTQKTNNDLMLVKDVTVR